MGCRLPLLLALVTAALWWPASALAATGQIDDSGVMVYTADPGESNAITFTFGQDQFGHGAYLVVDAPAVSITAVSPCQPGTAQNEMSCPADGGGIKPPVTALSASLGDGNDTISIQANIPTSIGGGGGDDTMNGGPAADNLRGGDQNDAIDGGDGDDTEDGQDGADTVRGGLGDDTLNGGPGNDLFPAEAAGDGTDVLNGGDGVDTASYSARTDPLTLSLDDQPNDGLAGNASDNIHTDVENLIGGSAGDALSGSDQPNSLDGGGGDDSITAGAGDDALTGGAGNDAEAGGDGADQLSGDGGDDSLDGGAGPDAFQGGDGTDLADYSSRAQAVAVTLDDAPGDGELGENDDVHTDVENVRGGGGADTLIGSGAGNTLDGGAGEDYSDGGPGSDTLVGGDAGDVLRTRGSADGDTINCGPGPDFVIAKPNDTIGPDCDRADRGVNQKPVRRDSAVVTPVTGSLQMSPAGIARRVPLQDKVVLPLRSIVDTVAGSVKVTSAPTVRKSQTVSLDDGAFDITQTSGKVAVTQFALQGGDFSVCPTAAGRAARAAAVKKSSTKPVRSLWASGKGNFRTKGRYAAATIRGTRWETVDRCDGTLIRVSRGAVAVRDLVKKRTVVVKAGRWYLAKR